MNESEPNMIYGIGDFRANIYYPKYSTDYNQKELFSLLTEIRKISGKEDLQLFDFIGDQIK